MSAPLLPEQPTLAQSKLAAGRPRIAVALGGGGARGLAHIAVLEALDELGLAVVALAGTSMGAIIGAAYAAGLSGQDLRTHVEETLRHRPQVMARLLKARVGRFAELMRGSATNPVLIDGEAFLDLFWPQAVPDRFEELSIPLSVVATDYWNCSAVIFDRGPLSPAVAGSMAIPGLIRPVPAGERVLVDGGAVNPLPFDLLMGHEAAVLADLVIACDVGGAPQPAKMSKANKATQKLGGANPARGALPQPLEAILGASQIMQAAITTQMLQHTQPDILVRPAVEGFRALDFFKVQEILAAASAGKDALKREIDAKLATRNT